MEDLPPAVRALLRRHVGSVSDLETLLLLAERADRAWTAEQLRQALYLARDAVQAALDRMAAAGLVTSGDWPDGATYRFDPARPEDAQTVAELAVIYRQRRVRVIEEIYSRPLHSVRSFAHAFRFKKERDE